MPRLTASVQKLFSDNKKKIFPVWLLFEITNNLYAGTISLPANTSHIMYGANAPINRPYYGFSLAKYNGSDGSIANGSIHVDNGSNNIMISSNVADGTLFYTPYGNQAYYITSNYGGYVTITDGLDIYSNTGPGTLYVSNGSISNSNYTITIDPGVIIRSTGSNDVMNFSANKANVTINNNGTIGSSSNPSVTAISLGVASNNLIVNYGDIYGDIISYGENTTIKVCKAGQIYGGLYHAASGTHNLNIQVNSDRTYDFNHEVNNFNISSNVNISVSNGGRVYGSSNFNNPGVISINGGTFSLPITNNAGQYVQVSAGNLNSSIANNYGYVQVMSGGTSNGDITNNNGGIISVVGGNQNGNITNNTGGSIIIFEGSVGGSIINSGSISMDGGTISSALTNNGGGSMLMTGGDILGSNSLGNAGRFNFSNGKISLNAAINNTGTFLMNGGTIAGNGNINNSGITNISGGTITTTTTIANNSSGTLTMTGGTITGSGSITNNGTITVNKGATISSTGTITNNATLDLEGGIITSPINNQDTGLFIVGGGSTLSGTTSFTNAGTLQANPGGTISLPITFNQSTGGMVNLAGGYITGTITGSGSSKEIINILADGNSAQMLSQVKNIGNIFVNTNNFTINTAIKGVNYNFITGYGSNITISGGDISGNGAISNAGVLKVSGGTIGADSAMGNVINSGVFEVAGDVKVRNFTNGINQPPGIPLLTSIDTINIVVNDNEQPDGHFGLGSVDGRNIVAPTQKIFPNPVYFRGPITAGTALDVATKTSINLTDPVASSDDIVTLMAQQGTINFSQPLPAGVIARGLGGSVVCLRGSISAIGPYIDNALRFTPTFNSYGVGTVTINVNDNSTNGVGISNMSNGSNNESLNSGNLNITSNTMTTGHVTNTLGNINILGGDLSGSISNAYNITNSPFASDYQQSNINTNTITVSNGSTIGKNAIFNNIINNGILIIKDATSTVNASTITLTNNANYTINTSGIMTTSGIINAAIKFSGNEILNINGGKINNAIIGLDTLKASTINITGDFATSNNITNINNINVTNNSNGTGNFAINNQISGLDTQFTIAKGATVTINNTGALSGKGVITNAGTMTIASPPKATNAASSDVIAANADVIGTLAAPMGVFTNTGVVNINANKVYVSEFINNDSNSILNIAGGSLITNVTNTHGHINVKSGTLSGKVDNASGSYIIISDGNVNSIVNNASGGNIAISGTANISGTINNNSQALINIDGGTVSGDGIVTNDGTFNLSSSQLQGRITNNPTGVMKIAGGIIYGAGKIDNQGILTVNKDSIINIDSILLTKNNNDSAYSSIMTTSGIINSNIKFSSNEILNIDGGKINNAIIGLDTLKASTINITGDFATSNNITNINNINVTNDSNGTGNFAINNQISGLDTQFTIAKGATVTINNTGALSGKGVITNAGTMTIASPPKNTSATSGDVVIAAANADVIGTLAAPMGVFTNTGAVNINANNAYVTSFINNNAQAILTVAGGSLKAGANGFSNTLGTVNISSGNISSLLNNNYIFTNNSGQTITISGTGVIGNTDYAFNQVNNSGIINVKDNGLINAPIANAGQLNLYVADSNLGNITNKLSTTPGTINVNTGGVLQDNNLAIAGGTINLNSGGIINKPIVFDVQGGILNLVGGTLNNNVYSSLATGSGVGIINVKIDYTYDDAHSINNISQFNVKSGTTTIKSAITNINESASVAQGATMIINNQGNISGSAAALTNSGIITLNTGGTLSLPIVFSSNGGVLNLSGGYLTTSISGSGVVGSGKGTINLTSGTNYSDFDQHISNIDTINSQGTSFSINDPITSINTAFNVVQGSLVTINTNGYLSGNGTINNSGIITLAGGTIGISADKIGKINNSGTINVNNNIYVAGNIVNNGSASTSFVTGENGIFDTTPAVSNSNAAQAAAGIIVNNGGNIYGNVGSILQNYGVVTLNKSGSINIPVDFGTVDAGILNLSGGTMNANILGGDRISTSAGTVNVNVDTIYTGNGYTIDHVNNINVNNTSIFNIKSNILGVNGAFTIASGATANIDNAAEISGKAVITNAGTLYVKNGNLGSGTQSFVNLQNKGTLNVDTTGSIYATLINHNGSMTTSGNIHAPILFGSNITQLNIGGGIISGIITGYTADPNAVSNANVINIIGDFSTSNNINDVAAIKVKQGTFNINNPIAGLSNNFSTIYSTTTNLNSSINGPGIINNIGTMNVLSGGSIGILGVGGEPNTPFSNIYNAGIFNMNTGSTIIVNNIYNGSYAPSSSDSQSTAGQFNTYGNININVTALNLNIDLNSQSITGALPGTQTTTENTSLTFSTANKNAITLAGIDDNGGTMQLTAAHGRLSIPSANTADLASISGNNTDTVILAGSLNTLNNALQGLIFIPDANYVGTDANIEIYLRNNQVVSASDGTSSTNVDQPPADYIPTFNVNGSVLQTKILDNVSHFVINGGTNNLGDVTNHAANAVLNITAGLATVTSVTNTQGTINISGGDLSSKNPASASTLTNAENQIINISDSGTIGANQSLGVVTNKGIINADGGNITIEDFSNQNVAAQLNITKGIVRTGNISNTLGIINISGGDLSSKNPASASTLTNAENQIINISDSGTIGANQSLGIVTNKGIINANGGNITIGDFSNQNVAAQLNITKGIVRTGNISNTLGIISISGGDLSSAGLNPSTLTNAVGQVVTISGTGTIGVNRALGIFNNNGVLNVNRGGNIGSVSTIRNSGVVNMMQPATMNNGNYILTNTGAHIVNIDPSNIPSTLTLTNGTTTLQPHATIDIKYNGDVLVPNNYSYNVIVNSSAPSTPGIDANNNINSINILGSTDLVYYTPHLQGNNIQVVSHRKLIEDIVDNVGNYPATPAATVLDDLINSGVATGDLRTALARLDGLGTDQEVSDAVNQLLPETSITSDIGFIAPSMTFSTITERAELIARSGIDNNQTGYAYGGKPINNSFWVKGFGGSMQQKQKVTTAGYTASTAGLAFGVDNQLFENTWLGLGFSTVNTHVNSKDVSAKKTTVVTQQATLYASYSPENYYIDSLMAMAFNSYKLQRGIIYNNLNYRSQAAYNAIQPAAKIAAGYIYDVNPVFKIIPNLSLQYSLLRQSTYTEYGAGNLSLRDVTSPILTQLEGGAGVKFSFLQEQDEQTYKPELHFMVLHDFKSTAQTTTAQFIGGGGTFAIKGTQPNKTSYNAGLGFTAIHQDQFNFTLRYDFKYRNKFIGHSGYLAVRYMF